jgi:hypothetical protein
VLHDPTLFPAEANYSLTIGRLLSRDRASIPHSWRLNLPLVAPELPTHGASQPSPHPQHKIIGKRLRLSTSLIVPHPSSTSFSYPLLHAYSIHYSKLNYFIYINLIFIVSERRRHGETRRVCNQGGMEVILGNTKLYIEINAFLLKIV